MNRMFDLKLMIKVTLILTLSMAIVCASGCRKKQPDKSPTPPKTTASKKQKSSENYTSQRTATPDVKANNQTIAILSDANKQQTATEPDVNQKDTVAMPDTPTDTNKPAANTAQGQTETVAEASENPGTTEQMPSAEPEEIIPARPLKLESFAEINNIGEKIKFISDFASASPALLDELVDMALTDASPEVRAAAMDELAKKGVYDPQIIPLIEKALVDADPAVRQKAIAACEHINDPAISDILSVGLEDESENVRDEAIRRLTEQKDLAIRLPVLEAGITSPHADIRAATLTEAMHTRNSKAVPILIEGLRDIDPDNHYTAGSMLTSIFGLEFETYEQATQWWNENRHNYDENLKLKPVNPAPGTPASPNTPGN